MKLLLLFISLIISADLFAQEVSLYDIEKRLREGDKNALFEIAPYFDSQKEITEYLGYHIIQTTESNVAKRITLENTLFIEQEMVITEETKADEFLMFLHKNIAKIYFSELTAAFMITPLTNRPARVAFREMPNTAYDLLRPQYSKLLKREWVKEYKIDSFIRAKDPKALLLIASAFYNKRYRFNEHNFDKEECIYLLQLLTGVEMAVDDDRNILSFHIEKEFYSDAALNMLIYFAENYVKFIWDKEQKKFVNKEMTVVPIGNEHELFARLNSKKDAVALNAFIKLTTCTPGTVVQLAKEYDHADIPASYYIPQFPYRFLQQLVVLTQYCVGNNIDFIGSEALRNDIAKLSKHLSFTERRELEDKLIRTLTLDDITALEYWTLIREQNWNLIFSTGRIVDIFYSKHWQEMVNNDRYLKLYLKKGYLYDNLGIVGNCGEFLLKFINNGNVVCEKLERLQTDDKDINQQVISAKALCAEPIHGPDGISHYWEGNNDSSITDIAAKIGEIKWSEVNQEDKERALIKLLALTSYNQIDTVLNEIEEIKFEKIKYIDKYSFMKDDWGFLFEASFNSRGYRKEFLHHYKALSEYDLYAYYLKKGGIDYQHPDGTLDYDKIYDILKHNIVDSFVGGGGAWRDNEVYSLIKLLEITHNSTLGFPKKRCSSAGVYGCNAANRATAWRQYLVDHHLLKQTHDEPVSFNYR